MDIRKSILGRPSYFYSVGFFAILNALPLLYTVKTPLYSQVSSLIKATPLSSVLAASPGLFILGILINQARIIIKKYLFRTNIYRITNLSEPSKEAIEKSILEALKISKEEVDLKTDFHFEEAKLLMMPLFDHYTIVYRWINDFLENTILISVFSLLIIGFRAIGYSFEGIEFILMEICLVVIIVSSVSIIGLPKKYTIAETSIFLGESLKIKDT